MPDTTVTIKGDKALIRKLNRLISNAKDPTAIHKKMALSMIKPVNDQFTQEGKRFNTPWLPLNPKTVKYRRSGSSRILQNTGRHLKKSLNHKGDRRSARVGFSSPLAPYHQFGTKSKRGRLHIPARPMLPEGGNLDKVVREVVLPVVERAIGQLIG